jgi:hypothetical protein
LLYAAKSLVDVIRTHQQGGTTDPDPVAQAGRPDGARFPGRHPFSKGLRVRTAAVHQGAGAEQQECQAASAVHGA